MKDPMPPTARTLAAGPCRGPFHQLTVTPIKEPMA
jgi:hypothetical protein